MLIHFKRLGQQVFIYGLGDTINKIIGILIVPVFTRYLTPTDYGVAGILSVANTLLASFCDLGLVSAISRFYHDSNDPERKRMIATAQVVSVGITLAIAIFAIPFSRQISSFLLTSPDYGYIVKINFFVLPLTLSISAPLMQLRLEQKAKFYAGFNVARVTFGIALNVVLVIFLHRGIKGLFEGPLINALLQAIFVWSFVFRGSVWQFSKGLFRKMLAFGFPFVFGSISVWLLNWADRFIMARLTTLSEVGLYSLGYAIGMAIMLPVGAFSAAWVPFMMSVVKQSKAKKIYAYVATYYSIVIGFFVLFLGIFSRDYFYFFTRSEYHSAYIVVPLIAFAYAFQGLFSIMVLGSYIKKKPSAMIIVQVIAMIVNILLILILVPKMGRMGAAWATFASCFIMPALIIIFTHKIYPIRYEYTRIVKVIVVGVGVFLIANGIYQPNVMNLLLRFGIILSYPLIFWLTGFFNKDESKKILDFKDKLFHKLRITAHL